jgi:prephenate dehydrogenase
VRVAVVGTGLIGGSVGLALARRGYEVAGYDVAPERVARAKELGAVTEISDSVEDAARDTAVTVIATPVGQVVDLVTRALAAGARVVTDVGSVKGPIVGAVEGACGTRARSFVGGHPMAGSEQEGIEGADPDLFVGATWVLTPTPSTDTTAYVTLLTLIRDIGADVVTVTPEHHDVLVALVSHVPQLAASTLMDVAIDHEEEHRTLLRLAAGGFRDMTRIAAGHPAIWPDILAANRDAVLAGLDAYLDALQRARDLVSGADRDGLLSLLERARAGRRSLPVGAAVDMDLIELRIPVPDRPGVIAEVTTLAGQLGVNVADLEIAHSLEGGAGVVVLVVAADGAPALEDGLHALGYHTSRTMLP